MIYLLHQIVHGLNLILLSHIFGSLGQSPDGAIVLPPALASAAMLAKCESFYVKSFLCDGQGAVR